MSTPQAIVMEYIQGITLNKFLKTSTCQKGLKTHSAAAAEFSNFHDSGFAHLDLHTNNIIMDIPNMVLATVSPD